MLWFLLGLFWLLATLIATRWAVRHDIRIDIKDNKPVTSRDVVETVMVDFVICLGLWWLVVSFVVLGHTAMLFRFMGQRVVKLGSYDPLARRLEMAFLDNDTRKKLRKHEIARLTELDKRAIESGEVVDD